MLLLIVHSFFHSNPAADSAAPASETQTVAVSLEVVAVFGSSAIAKDGLEPATVKPIVIVVIYEEEEPVSARQAWVVVLMLQFQARLPLT